MDPDALTNLALRDDTYPMESNERQTSLKNLKKASDGHTILIPQPNADPNNPLLWSKTKKWMVLLAVSFAAVYVHNRYSQIRNRHTIAYVREYGYLSRLPDYGSATGAVTLIAQGAYWDLVRIIAFF